MSGGHSERAHSPLGASGAYRWMECPGSVAACEGLPNITTQFAAEGTAAHELGERCLRDGTDAAEHLGERITVGNHVFEVDQGLAEAVQEYLDTVRADRDEGDLLFIEERFHLSHLHPDLWGTNDAAVYKQRDARLIVYDYKHGQGIPVSPVNNPQLIYYGIGLLNAQAMKGLPVATVELVIVQPRASKQAVKRWEVDVLELLSFSFELKASAEATEKPDAPRNAGDWCRFCPASGTCATLADQAMAAAEHEFGLDVAELGNDRLSRIVEQADLIQYWVKAVHGELARRMKEGQRVPGWKFVLGRPGNRVWSDAPAAADFVKKNYGFEDADVSEPPKLLSPAKLEKLLPKTERGELARFISRPDAKPSLVPITDPRPEVTFLTAEDEFDDAYTG